jgi:exodeoxyribonuclease VII small subunit
MMAKKNEISYNEAFQEMEIILEKIENEELDVDQLSSSLKKVSHLMKLCRGKLRKTETEVEKILKEMEED